MSVKMSVQAWRAPSRLKEVVKGGAFALHLAAAIGTNRLWLGCRVRQWPCDVDDMVIHGLVSYEGRVYGAFRKPIRTSHGPLATLSRWIDITPKRRAGTLEAGVVVDELQVIDGRRYLLSNGEAFIVKKKPKLRIADGRGYLQEDTDAWRICPAKQAWLLQADASVLAFSLEDRKDFQANVVDDGGILDIVAPSLWGEPVGSKPVAGLQQPLYTGELQRGQWVRLGGLDIKVLDR